MGIDNSAKEYQSASDGMIASRHGTSRDQCKFAANESAVAVQNNANSAQRARGVKNELLGRIMAAIQLLHPD